MGATSRPFHSMARELLPRSAVPKKASPSERVAVVASNPETVDGVATYLGNSGIVTRGSCAIDALSSLASTSAALVFFPDEYAAGRAVSVLRDVQRARPRLFIVVVTKHPQRFKSVLDTNGRSVTPLLLPKPSFGWSILDALRANAVERREGR
jgi:hypothetical protein